MHSPTTKRIAKAVGVTAAGLVYLAKLAATGKSQQRGNEATKLEAQGFIVEAGHTWAATDAGREIVARARQMGW